MSNSRPCAFDPIIAGTAPAHMVLEDTDVVAFLDARPVFPGHTLVVPRSHYSTVAELPDGLPGRLWEAGARIAAAQRVALDAAGTFFGLNDVISQSVPHVHLHVVPRRARDGLRGFFWPRQRYVDDDQAAAVAAAIRRALRPTADRPAPGAPPSHPATAPATAAATTAATTTASAAATTAAATTAAAACPPMAARSPVVVRDARPDDAAAVAAILSGGSIDDGEDPGDPTAYRAAIEATSSGPGAVLTAELAGEVVGVCQLLLFRHIQHRGGRCAEIESMHVAREHRGGGIGSALLSAAVERARAAGCYRVQLTSNKVRADAHRFYQRHGFVASHEGFKLYF